MDSILENGRETLDQTPVSYPLHFQRPTPLHIRIRNMILAQLEESKSYDDVDTADEADDFDIDDEFDGFSSPYEMEDDFDHLSLLKGAKGEISSEELPPVSDNLESNSKENL